MDAGLQCERSGTAGERALHNMSAPPTLRITIRPLTAVPPDTTAGRLPVPGYRCIARVDLEALLRERFGGARPGSKRRLAALVLLARGEPDQEPDALARLARRAAETLQDELRALAARLDPRALGLPVFAVARIASASDARGLPDAGPATALALLTRTAGQVFVAGRSPRLVWLAEAVPVYRYFTPAPAGTGEEAP
jgi:hypothetical protein